MTPAGRSIAARGDTFGPIKWRKGRKKERWDAELGIAGWRMRLDGTDEFDDRWAIVVFHETPREFAPTAFERLAVTGIASKECAMRAAVAIAGGIRCGLCSYSMMAVLKGAAEGQGARHEKMEYGLPENVVAFPGAYRPRPSS